MRSELHAHVPTRPVRAYQVFEQRSGHVKPQRVPTAPTPQDFSRDTVYFPIGGV